MLYATNVYTCNPPGTRFVDFSTLTSVLKAASFILCVTVLVSISAAESELVTIAFVATTESNAILSPTVIINFTVVSSPAPSLSIGISLSSEPALEL